MKKTEKDPERSLTKFQLFTAWLAGPLTTSTIFIMIPVICIGVVLEVPDALFAVAGVATLVISVVWMRMLIKRAKREGMMD